MLVRNKILIVGGSGLLGLNRAIRRRNKDKVFITTRSCNINIPDVSRYKLNANHIKQVRACLGKIGVPL